MARVYYRGGSDTVSEVEVVQDLTADGKPQFKVIAGDFDSEWKVKPEELSKKIVDPATVKPMTKKQFKKLWKEYGLDQYEIGAEPEEDEE